MAEKPKAGVEQKKVTRRKKNIEKPEQDPIPEVLKNLKNDDPAPTETVTEPLVPNIPEVNKEAPTASTTAVEVPLESKAVPEQVEKELPAAERFDFLLVEIKEFVKRNSFCRLRNLKVVEDKRARLQYHIMRGTTKYATLRPGRGYHTVFNSGLRTNLLREPTLREFFSG